MFESCSESGSEADWGLCRWLKDTAGMLSSTWGKAVWQKPPGAPYPFFTASLGSDGRKRHTAITVFILEHYGLPSRSSTPWSCGHFGNGVIYFQFSCSPVSIPILKPSLHQVSGVPSLWLSKAPRSLGSPTPHYIIPLIFPLCGPH